MRVSLEDPLVLVRIAVAFLLAFGTLVAATFWIVANDARFLKLVVALWAVYGFTVGVVDGLLTPLVDGAARTLQGLGARGRPDFASVAALLAGGHYALAAERYQAMRAGAPLSPDEDLRVGLALVNLYEYQLADPARAMVELSRLVESHAGTRRGAALRRMLKSRQRDPSRTPKSRQRDPSRTPPPAEDA